MKRFLSHSSLSLNTDLAEDEPVSTWPREITIKDDTISLCPETLTLTV